MKNVTVPFRKGSAGFGIHLEMLLDKALASVIYIVARSAIDSDRVFG